MSHPRPLTVHRRRRTAGLRPGTGEHADVFDRAFKDAEELGAMLDRNHVVGDEQVIWTHARGQYRGPKLNRLAEWQTLARGDVPRRPIVTDELTMGLRPILSPERDE